MDGSDTLEEFSEWEEAVEDAMEEARLQGCRSELALQQQRSDDSGPAKVRRRSGIGPAKVRQRSGEGPAEVRRRSSGGPAATEAEATATKRKDTLSSGYHVENKEAWWAHNPQVPGSEPGSDTMLRIKKIGIEINLPCV